MQLLSKVTIHTAFQPGANRHCNADVYGLTGQLCKGCLGVVEHL